LVGCGSSVCGRAIRFALQFPARAVRTVLGRAAGDWEAENFEAVVFLSFRAVSGEGFQAAAFFRGGLSLERFDLNSQNLLSIFDRFHKSTNFGRIHSACDSEIHFVQPLQNFLKRWPFVRFLFPAIRDEQSDFPVNEIRNGRARSVWDDHFHHLPLP
jgi:hypothetical protein